MMGWDVFSDWAYEGGAFCLYGGMSWALQMGAERARLAGDVAAYTAMLAAAKSLPLYEERMAWPAVLQRFAQYTHYGDWIGNPAPGDYWDRISPKAALAGRIDDVPTLHVGGWYDKMLEGTLGAWQAMAASRAPQRLVVGPWGHIPWGRRAGIIDFGPEASSRSMVEAALVRSLPEGPGQRHRARAAGPTVRCRSEGVARSGALAQPAATGLASVEQGACGRAQRRRRARPRATSASEPRHAGARSVAAGAVAGRP